MNYILLSYAECHYAKYHNADYHYADYHNADYHYADYHYADYHYAECCGASKTSKQLQTTVFLDFSSSGGKKDYRHVHRKMGRTIKKLFFPF